MKESEESKTKPRVWDCSTVIVNRYSEYARGKRGLGLLLMGITQSPPFSLACLSILALIYPSIFLGTMDDVLFVRSLLCVLFSWEDGQKTIGSLAEAMLAY